MIKKRGNRWWVVVYAGRDPLTGKKRHARRRHRRDRQHRGQCMPSATPMPGVGDLGEVVEQVTVLVVRQERQPLGDSGKGE